MSRVIVRNWLKVHKRRQFVLTGVERQLHWVPRVTLFSDTVDFRNSGLQSCQGKKPLASGIDQSFGFQSCNESLEAWEKGVMEGL